MRDYAFLSEIPGGGARQATMERFVVDFWRELHTSGVSWVGFYLGPGAKTHEGTVVGRGEMLLCAREPKPACSPIGLHGACGQSWSQGETLIVTDVKHLGEGYVACDPRDTSELVIPCFNEDGSAWGVLDLDSFAVGSFDESDARGLAAALFACGLSAKPAAEIPVRII